MYYVGLWDVGCMEQMAFLFIIWKCAVVVEGFGVGMVVEDYVCFYGRIANIQESVMESMS